MKAGPALANGAWLVGNLPAWQRYRRGLEKPEETQWRLLERSLRKNASCRYGRAYGFGEIRRYEDFCARLPVVGYQDLEPSIEKIKRGEAAVLTREPVTRLVPTSGTTSGRKLIPFTAGLQREFNRAIGPWMVDLNRAHPAVAFGASYWSISPRMASIEDSSVVPVGFDDDSAYLGGVRRRLIEATFAAPAALRLVDGLENFRYLTLLCLLRQPEWSFASVWHPSFLTLLFDALPGHWEELLADLARGGCRRAAGERPEVGRALQAGPMRRRADGVRRVGACDLHALWPRLRVVSCWGQGQATVAARALCERLPQAAVQPKGLLATEAFVSIPFRERHPLAITSHFFEFIDEHDRVLRAHELRLGGRYTTVVTTAGGLWRYRLGDVVEVDGLVGCTPSMRFCGREGGGSDLRGEKLTEDFVAGALSRACNRCGFRTGFAMLAPETDVTEQPRYALFVEGDAPPRLAAAADDELRRNPHYAVCRDLGQLGPVDCVPMAGGAFQVFCEVQMAAGRRLGDIKPAALSTRTDWRRQFRENGGIRPSHQE